jgi:hypothetical protein
MNHEAPSEETLVQKTKAYRHPTGRKLNRAEKRIMSAAIKAADGANLDVETVIGWKPDAVPPRNPRKSPGRGPRRIGFNRLRACRDVTGVRGRPEPVAPAMPSDGALLAGKSTVTRWRKALVRFLTRKGASAEDAALQAHRRLERERSNARASRKVATVEDADTATAE